MGLDMYLYRKSNKYRLADGTYTNGKGMNFEDYYKSDDFGCSNRVEFSENVAYWRKANSIHRWFVNNVQDGVDECQESYVTIDNLKKLYNICKNIIDKANGCKMWIDDEMWESIKKFETQNCKPDPRVKDMVFDKDSNLNYLYSYKIELSDELKELIKDTLPTCDGFFFGSTDFDGGYLYDLIKTMKMFERIFKDEEEANKNGDYFDYSYHASW